MSSTPSLSHTTYLIPLAITAVTLTVTMIAGYITQKAVNLRLRDNLNRQADQITTTYYNRLLAQVAVLEGLRALWNTKGSFTQKDFNTYLSSIDLGASDKSGTSSFIYVPVVTTDKVKEFEHQMRKETIRHDVYEKFSVHPIGNWDIHYPVAYLYPLTEMREFAIGLDWVDDKDRLNAVEFARDNNTLSTTKAVILRTTNMPGFFVMIPLYKPGSSLERKPERKEAFAGVVAAVYRSDESFEQIFGDKINDPYPNLDFQIYRGNGADPNQLLYDHDSSYTTNDPYLNTTRTIRIMSQIWTITVESKPSFALMNAEQKLPTIVFISGIVATIFLAMYSTYNLAKFKHSYRI